ncbi:MAG: Nif3-like dinuclear metal center hexameric protein [Candidatus Lokiarchaeota archaeon]|nr:Nif3-like dinuclear metal center hexameric protein [Candidatus Lokiarchaeota archaeon]
MHFKELRIILETKIAPKNYKKPNEFYGVQYGDLENEKNIKRILLTLDLNLEAIHHAIKNKVDLIISHHGLLMKPISYINKILINKLNLLAKFPLNIYILGSSFIGAEEGVSETISNILYLRIEEIFRIKYNKNKLIPIGRICTPLYYPNEDKENFTLEKLLKRIKINFSTDKISYVGNLNRKIKKMCIVGGDTNNSEYLEKAKKHNCDCYISSNINHEISIIAKEIGLNLVNLSHHNTEFFALKKLNNYLSLEFPYDEFLLFETNDSFKTYF